MIIDYHSLLVFKDKTEQELVQVGLALRLSGGVDFYYDYRLVESSEQIPGNRIYTAIDADFLKLRFKCLKFSKKTKSLEMKEYECLTRW